jgi:hypothetical protein
MTLKSSSGRTTPGRPAQTHRIPVGSSRARSGIGSGNRCGRTSSPDRATRPAVAGKHDADRQLRGVAGGVLVPQSGGPQVERDLRRGGGRGATDDPECPAGRRGGGEEERGRLRGSGGHGPGGTPSFGHRLTRRAGTAARRGPGPARVVRTARSLSGQGRSGRDRLVGQVAARSLARQGGGAARILGAEMAARGLGRRDPAPVADGDAGDQQPEQDAQAEPRPTPMPLTVCHGRHPGRTPNHRSPFHL